MRRLNRLISKLLILASCLVANQAWSAQPPVKLVVSIPPLAMMVAPLLEPTDEIQVLLTPGATPHGFQLKPSHLKAMAGADLVLSVGTGVDGWLAKSLQAHAGAKLNMFAQPGLVKLQKRSGGVWQDHHHHAAENQPVARIDGHIWLSLRNATLMVQAVSASLQQQFPARAAKFAEREQQLLAQFDSQNQAWLQQLKPLAERKFIVMHDAYQYFEQDFGLQAAGTIHVNPELPPSAKLLQQLRQKIDQDQVVCVFAEPQFPANRLDALVRGLQINQGKMDPLGDFAATQNYADFYQQLVANFAACVGRQAE